MAIYSGRPLGVPTLAPRWMPGLLAAAPLGDVPIAGPVLKTRDYVNNGYLAAVGTLTGGSGLFGPRLLCADPGGGIQVGGLLYGATQFTLAAYASTDTSTGGAAGLRLLWAQETATSADLRFGITGGVMFFQLGADGAFTNLNATLPTLNIPQMLIARLAPGGVRSIWYGPLKVAERTDASIAFPAGSGDVLALGTSTRFTARCWSGTIDAGYVWDRALADTEIAELADVFAPIRPYPPRAWLPFTTGIAPAPGLALQETGLAHISPNSWW